jgi:hypothetical protein
MARTALIQLQEQIEVIRQEAYAAGYAAAMRAIRELSATPLTASAPSRGRTAKPSAPAVTKKPSGRKRQSPVAARPARAVRPPRGSNAASISEILREAGPDFVRPAVIRTQLQSQKNTSMAFTSIRHALGQLEARREVERSADGKSWRYTGAGS